MNFGDCGFDGRNVLDDIVEHDDVKQLVGFERVREIAITNIQTFCRRLRKNRLIRLQSKYLVAVACFLEEPTVGTADVKQAARGDIVGSAIDDGLEGGLPERAE